MLSSGLSIENNLITSPKLAGGIVVPKYLSNPFYKTSLATTPLLSLSMNLKTLSIVSNHPSILFLQPANSYKAF